MDFGITDKVALVSGGTSGIGFAAAQALLAEGVKVAIFSRSQENVNRAYKELGANETQLLALTCDTIDSSSVSKMLTAVREKFGSIDIFIGSSGGPAFGQANEVVHDDLVTALESNFVALAALTNLLLPDMRKKNWGRIVYVTTSGVIQPVPNLALSNVARSALTSFAKTLSNEIAGDGVTVNSVIPGRIDTDRLQTVNRSEAEANGVSYEEQRAKDSKLIPARRYGQPEEIANVITFLCSNSASYVTGVKIPVDGGMIKSV